MTARHFRDMVKVWRMSGVVEEVEQWEAMGGGTPYNGKLMDKSGTSYRGDGTSQAYDATVILVTSNTFLEPNDRYKVQVDQYKTKIEGPVDDDPALKRTRYLEVVSLDVKADNAGTDVFQVLRCSNGHQ